MKNKIFQSRALCLCALDTNSTCAKNVRRNEGNYEKTFFCRSYSFNHDFAVRCGMRQKHCDRNRSAADPDRFGI